MKRYIATLLFVMAASGQASAQGERQMTLKEAVKLAVEKNLDVQAELYNPASAEVNHVNHERQHGGCFRTI